MALENITGSLLDYKVLLPGTFQHSDQLITEQRINPQFRGGMFHTADGELYTIQRGEYLWGITREPQNLVLQNIDEACRQFAHYRNYFPDNEAAQASFEHKDTVVVDLGRLINEVGSDGTQEYFLFNIDPEKVVKRTNSEKRKVAQRIYGPDEENFCLNMEMFAEAKIRPTIFVLRPNYFRDLSGSRKFLARASNLNYYNFSANFGKSEWCGESSDMGVSSRISLRGVPRVITGDDKRI